MARYSRHRDHFHRFTQRKAVRRDEHVVLARLIGVDRHKTPLGEFFGIDDFRIDVGEDFEDGADSKVVPVAGNSVTDLPLTFEIFLKRLDSDQFADLSVAEYSHE